MLRQSKQKAEIGGNTSRIDKALLTCVNEMHAQGVYVSSEMIKEMGIRILERVNEMLPDEKKTRSTFSKGCLFQISNVGNSRLENVRCDRTMHIGHAATFKSMI